MATRVKMALHYKQQQPTNDSTLLQFGVVYSGSEENEKFFQYTPGGQLNFYVVRPEIAEQFEVGKEYYIDIFKAE